MEYIKLFVSIIIPILALSLSRKLSFLDKPNKTVKTHKSAIPYVGGLSFLILSLFYMILYGFNFPIFIMLLISLIGTADDKYNFSAYIRLILEILLCSILVITMISGLNFIYMMFLVLLGVTLINAFNFIDIKDGLMTSYALSLFLFLLNIKLIDSSFLTFISMYLFSLLTIYALNSEPAIAYQGDGGAYAVAGVAFTSILYILKNNAVNISNSIFSEIISSNFLSINYLLIITFCVLLSLFPVLFEIVFVIIIRLRNNSNPLLPSNDHIALRFFKRGYSTYKIAFIFMILPFLSNLIIAAYQLEINSLSLIIAPTFLIIFCYKFLLLL